MRYPCGAPASLALLMTALLLASCSSVTDFDRFHRAEDGGTGRDGSADDAGTDAGGDTDAGPCDEPVAEVCNDADDDCDGMVDEDFDLDGDPQNCGSCGRSCPEVPNSSPGCAAGACAAQCDVGWGDCDADYINGCETDLTAPDDCAACGTVCAAGSFCSASGCVTDCPGEDEVCGRTCVDTESSAMHCGGCGNACPSRDHSTPACSSGSCEIVCDAGWDDCDGNPDNGCEVDLSTISDCGSCDTVCSYPNGVAACTAGMCELMACNSGYDDCDANDANGCEADLGTVASCGSCGVACAEPGNSTAMCTGTGCGFTCDSGWADCNSDASDGCEADLSTAADCGSCGTACSGGTPLCESGTCVSGCSGSTPTLCSGSCVDTTTDPLHCGACGAACPDRAHSSPTCSSSTCGFTCDPGYADCNAMASDGCETDTRTVSSCGACGAVCDVANGTPTCSTGTCAVASCDTGWDDCDSDVSNGCETSLSSVTDCRACGTTCTVANGTPTCSSTGCAIGSCDSGWDDCNGTYVDGCEAMLATYYQDMDGDGFGTSGTTMLGCPGISMSGWAMAAGDCDDADFTRYPGATELCNDVDDDCDGTIDDGFECRLGSTQSCTISSPGCIASGTQACTDTCSWGACMPPAEMCNRVDDDCNGFVDENQLAADTAFRVHLGGNPQDVRVAWSPSLGRGAVIYWATDAAGTNHLYLTQFRPDGMLFPTVTIDSGASDWDADVTSDGTAWALVYSREEGSGSTVRYARVARVSATGTIAGAGEFPAADTDTSGPREPRIAGANDGSDKIAVAWIEKSTSSTVTDKVRFASFGGGSLISTLRLDGLFGLTPPAITGLAADEFGIVWGYVDGTGAGMTRYRKITASGTVSPIHDLHTDTTPEEGHEIAYAAGPGHVVIGWTESPPAAASDARWSHGPSNSGGGSGELVLPAGTRALPGWAADGAYSIAYAGWTTGGALRRFRPTDDMPIPGDVTIGPGQVADMASMQSGPYRHVLAFIVSDSVRVRFIGCM